MALGTGAWPACRGSGWPACAAGRAPARPGCDCRWGRPCLTPESATGDACYAVDCHDAAPAWPGLVRRTGKSVSSVGQWHVNTSILIEIEARKTPAEAA